MAAVSKPLQVFAYGSLVNRSSLALTLERPVARVAPARLRGWARRWSLYRDNLASEKTFARADDGSLPPFCLGLNVEPSADADPPNGGLIEMSEAELDRLDLREMRYDRIEVTGAVVLEDGGDPPGRAFTYTAKPRHHAPEPPRGAVVLAPYVRAIEAAFETLGPAQLDRFRETTGPIPVEVVEAVLVRDEIPPGNPRAW
jgi:cation transport regulator ChaC